MVAKPANETEPSGGCPTAPPDGSSLNAAREGWNTSSAASPKKTPPVLGVRARRLEREARARRDVRRVDRRREREQAAAGARSAAAAASWKRRPVARAASTYGPCRERTP